jgi:hypothetical protein
VHPRKSGRGQISSFLLGQAGMCRGAKWQRCPQLGGTSRAGFLSRSGIQVTGSPQWTPPRGDPSRCTSNCTPESMHTHTNAHSVFTALVHTHLTHTDTDTDTDTHRHTQLLAMPEQLLSPPTWKSLQLTSRLKLFQRGTHRGTWLGPWGHSTLGALGFPPSPPRPSPGKPRHSKRL